MSFWGLFISHSVIWLSLKSVIWCSLFPTTVSIHYCASFTLLVLPLTCPLLPSRIRFGSRTAEQSSARSRGASRRSSFRSRRRHLGKVEVRKRTDLHPPPLFLTPRSPLHPPLPLPPLWRQRVLWSILYLWTWSWTLHQQNIQAVSQRQRTMSQIRKTRANLKEKKWSVRDQWHLGTSPPAKDSVLNQVRT